MLILYKILLTRYGFILSLSINATVHFRYFSYTIFVDVFTCSQENFSGTDNILR